MPSLGIEADTEALHPVDLAIMLAAGALAVWGSNELAAWANVRGVGVPSILILTMIALVAAQVPAVARLRGA